MDLYFQEHEVNPNSSNRRRRQSTSTNGSFSNHLNALIMNGSDMTRRSRTAPGSQTHDDRITLGASFNNMLPLLNLAVGDALRSSASDNKGPPPASKSEMDNLPRVHISTALCPGKPASSLCSSSSSSAVIQTEADSDNGVYITKDKLDSTPPCPICTEEFDIGDDITRLPCMHYFHRQCVIQWLSRNCSCPVCRKEIRTDDEDYEDMRRTKRREQAASQMRSFMFN